AGRRPRIHRSLVVGSGPRRPVPESHGGRGGPGPGSGALDGRPPGRVAPHGHRTRREHRRGHRPHPARTPHRLTRRPAGPVGATGRTRRPPTEPVGPAGPHRFSRPHGTGEPHRPPSAHRTRGPHNTSAPPTPCSTTEGRGPMPPPTAPHRRRRDTPPPRTANTEADVLRGFLDYLRTSMADKVDGAPEPGVRTAAVPSGTNLLGLLHHLRSEEHTSELQSRENLHAFPTRRSSDLHAPAHRPSPPTPGHPAAPDREHRGRRPARLPGLPADVDGGQGRRCPRTRGADGRGPVRHEPARPAAPP